MPFQTTKRDAADKLTLEWQLHVKDYKLTLDKTRCVGCQICSLACPKEAIKLSKQPKTEGQKTKHAKVDIDLAKCTFCGICDITCPYGAVTLTIDGQHALKVLDKESFPKLIRDIQVDTRKCEKECLDCTDACPLGLIKLTKTTYDGKPVEDINKLTPSERRHVQVNLEIKKEYCPTCRVCEVKCSTGAIKVKKAYEGKISIDQTKCPEGCIDCLDVCPITGALVLGVDKKVYVNEAFCDYCGACKAVCPAPEALTLSRTKVRHTAVHSGTWNKALERLTSPEAQVQEMKAAAAKKRKDLVARRFVLEENVR